MFLNLRGLEQAGFHGQVDPDYLYYLGKAGQQAPQFLGATNIRPSRVPLTGANKAGTFELGGSFVNDLWI